MARRARRRGRAGSWLSRGLRGLAWLAMAGLLATLLAVLPLRWIDPPTSAFMLRYAATGGQPAQHWVDWAEISPWLAIAAVAAEDQKFPLHHGFDVASIRAALAERSSRPRGASTISQQVAKNLYLWPGRSWLRKALEAWLTVWIEILLPKTRILEIYLNLAEFGPGVYGAGEASMRFLGKRASELTLDEAALLTAVLPDPATLSAARPSAYVRRRGAEIAEQVRLLGGPAWLRQ